MNTRIRKYRTDLGVSQQALANASGLSMSVVYKAERGANVTVGTMRSIAKGLTILGRPTDASELIVEAEEVAS